MSTVRRLVRSIFNTAHRPIGELNFRRALKESASTGLSLEIGANENFRDGWVATDVSWRCKHYLNVSRAWPVDAGTLNCIFADNVVEHLSLKENRILFAEAYRTLKAKGSIRLITPNIGELVMKYQCGLESDVALVNQLREENYEIAHNVDFLRFAFQDDGHHTGYLWDFDALRAELENAGFAEVTQYELGTTNSTEFYGADSRVGLSIAEVMLAVEARKP
jgi:predicted SAM-dependent methyltransferase